MHAVEQGDLLKVDGIAHPIFVVSNNFFNNSGKVIACPIIKKATPGPLHIAIDNTVVEGTVLCEQVRYLDLSARRFIKLSQAHYFETMDISDAVMGIFEYV